MLPEELAFDSRALLRSWRAGDLAARDRLFTLFYPDLQRAAAALLRRERGVVALAERLRARSPDDAGALHIVAIIGEVHAQVLGDLGRFAESFAAGERVTAAHRQLVALAGDAPGARRSMAVALRTRGGNHYNGGDYAGACRIWFEALAMFTQLDREGQLTATDRSNGVPELKKLTASSCNPSRAGAGAEV